MSTNEASKPSRTAAIGGGIVAALTCLALLSAEVRGWLGLSGGSGNSVESNTTVAQGNEGIVPPEATEPLAGTTPPTSTNPASLPVAAVPRLDVKVTSLRLKFVDQFSSGDIRMRSQVSIGLKNTSSKPLAVIWLRPNDNTRVEIDGAGVFKRLQDAGGVQYCGYSDGPDCWRRTRESYTVIDPGATVRATLEMQDDFSGDDRLRLASAKSAVLISTLHIVDPSDGSGAKQSISIDGLALDNQMPKS